MFTGTTNGEETNDNKTTPVTSETDGLGSS